MVVFNYRQLAPDVIINLFVSTPSSFLPYYAFRHGTLNDQRLMVFYFFYIFIYMFVLRPLCSTSNFTALFKKVTFHGNVFQLPIYHFKKNGLKVFLMVYDNYFSKKSMTGLPVFLLLTLIPRF